MPLFGIRIETKDRFSLKLLVSIRPYQGYLTSVFHEVGKLFLNGY